jgi:hypothetical protein
MEAKVGDRGTEGQRDRGTEGQRSRRGAGPQQGRAQRSKANTEGPSEAHRMSGMYGHGSDQRRLRPCHGRALARHQGAGRPEFRLSHSMSALSAAIARPTSPPSSSR